MTPEILSIIAVCISGLTAVCSATVPAILNYKAKKAVLAERREREQQHENEEKFEVFYKTHLQVITDFSTFYFRCKSEPGEYNKSKLVSFLNNLSVQFRDDIQKALADFAIKVKSFSRGDNFDDDYFNCLNMILSSYGVRVSVYTPNILMPDMLKIALRAQFDKLSKSTTDDLSFRAI